MSERKTKNERSAPRREIVLVGNPNVGKSTLFNALTGAHAHTGNWQGVTVGASSAQTVLRGESVTFTDLPGVYSLNGYSMEEKVASAYIRAHGGVTFVQVADARHLPRSLALSRELRREGRLSCLVLTMRRDLERAGGKVDEKALSAWLGVPVFAVNAYSKAEARAFKEWLCARESVRFGGEWQISKSVSSGDLPAGIYRAPTLKVSVIEKVLYSPSLCLPVFFLLTAAAFFLTFGGGMPGSLGKAALETLFCKRLPELAAPLFQSEWARALFLDGFLRSAGGVLSFLPQITLLYAFLFFLEESGVIGALAFGADGLFRKFGLNGRAVFCILLGFGCTAQAALSTRGFEKKEMQRRTLAALPYVSCSAKLPVYLTLLSPFFPHPFLGVVGVYALGVAVTLLIFYLSKGNEEENFILEVAPLRLPDPIYFVKTLLFRVKGFIIKIATVVTAFTLTVWFFSSFDFSLHYVPAERSMLSAVCGGLKFVFYPVGVRDWQTTFALLSGLVAKENVASLLAFFYPQGLPFSAATAFALAVFVLFCSPCVSAIAASAEEIGWKKSLWNAAWQTVTAVFAAYAAYFFVQNAALCLCAAAVIGILLLVKRFCFERVHRKNRAKTP